MQQHQKGALCIFPNAKGETYKILCPTNTEIYDFMLNIIYLAYVDENFFCGFKTTHEISVELRRQRRGGEEGNNKRGRMFTNFEKIYVFFYDFSSTSTGSGLPVCYLY